MTLFSYSSATKTTNSEGDVTITSWGTGTSVRGVSSNHYKVRTILGTQGEENNEGDRVIIMKDNVDINQRDKLVIGTKTYSVREVKQIDPIDNLLLAQRIVLSINPNY